MSPKFLTVSKVKSAITRIRREGNTDLALVISPEAAAAYPGWTDQFGIPVTVKKAGMGTWSVSVASERGKARGDSRHVSRIGVLRPTWLEEGEEDLWSLIPVYNTEAETQRLVRRFRGDLAGWLAHELDGLEVPLGTDVAVDSGVYVKLAATHEVHGKKAKLKIDDRPYVYTPYVEVAGRRIRTTTGSLRSHYLTPVHTISWGPHAWTFAAPLERFTQEQRETFHRLASDRNNRLGFEALVTTVRALSR